jgi:stage II sporulation protein D
MDQYLYGVTPSEIGSSSPLDAIKAQAIIARTYASLKAQSGAYADLGFDICPTTECQVFFGSKSETLRSNQAVDSTSGRVLLYGGKFAQTFFFSSTGGTVTEDPVYVWGGSIPYLKSVDSSVEDTGYSNYNWTIQLTKEQIKAKVTGIGDITNVQITGRAPSGRAIELKVSGTSGSKTYTKDTCRSILGLKSQMFEITTDIDGKNTYDPNANETIFDVVVADGTVWKEINARDLQFQTVDGTRTVTEGDTIDIVDADGSIKTVTILPHATPPPNTVTPNLYTFTGKGYGHAVGMSQTGAMGLAKLGYTYDQIIYHYFPGTTLS